MIRRATHGDAVAVARVLLDVRPARRPWVLARLFREAGRAHEHLVRHGAAHPVWGDGCLMTAALKRRPRREPGLDDKDYCSCVAQVYAVLAQQTGQPLAQETQFGSVGSRSRRAADISSPQS